jgi:hypothetical protein
MGTVSPALTRHAAASTAQPCVTTVAAGALSQLKWPDPGDDEGDCRAMAAAMRPLTVMSPSFRARATAGESP